MRVQTLDLRRRQAPHAARALATLFLREGGGRTRALGFGLAVCCSGVADESGGDEDEEDDAAGVGGAATGNKRLSVGGRSLASKGLAPVMIHTSCAVACLGMVKGREGRSGV